MDFLLWRFEGSLGDFTGVSSTVIVGVLSIKLGSGTEVREVYLDFNPKQEERIDCVTGYSSVGCAAGACV